MRKILIILAVGVAGLIGVAANQQMSLAENNKLRIAEAAIVQLYVDSVSSEITEFFYLLQNVLGGVFFFSCEDHIFYNDGCSGVQF